MTELKMHVSSPAVISLERCFDPSLTASWFHRTDSCFLPPNWATSCWGNAVIGWKVNMRCLLNRFVFPPMFSNLPRTAITMYFIYPAVDITWLPVTRVICPFTWPGNWAQLGKTKVREQVMFFLLLGVLCLVIGMMRSANERCVEKQQIPTDDFTGSLTDLTDTSIYLVFF